MIESSLMKAFFTEERPSLSILKELCSKKLEANSLTQLLVNNISQFKDFKNELDKSEKKKGSRQKSFEQLPSNYFFLPCAIYKLDLLLSLFKTSLEENLSGNLNSELQKIKNQTKKILKEVFNKIAKFPNNDMLLFQDAILLFFKYCVRLVQNVYEIFNNFSPIGDLISHVFILVNRIIHEPCLSSVFLPGLKKIYLTVIEHFVIPSNELQYWVNLLLNEFVCHLKHTDKLFEQFPTNTLSTEFKVNFNIRKQTLQWFRSSSTVNMN
jgi:hypothetical protein